MVAQCVRITADITGTVQGVGFRPQLFRLATAAGLAGSVQNRAGTVRLILEGDSEKTDHFLQNLSNRIDAPASIHSLTILERRFISCEEASSAFNILESDDRDPMKILIPPDQAICPDCLKDILDPANRRFEYPFTTCTRCGPRYTLVTAMPFDRRRTTMAGFRLCEDCRREYNDPDDRRFHAETIACPVCGPHLSFERADGSTIPADISPLKLTRRALAEGRTVGIRGVGGYLLAADAFNRATLARLRDCKQRPHKPLAVMAPSLDVLGRYCIIPPAAEQLLASPEAPIVILDVRPGVIAQGILPLELLTPDAPTLGAMLPTSPLHVLLMKPLPGDAIPPFDLLVMTSGNRRGEPICLTPDEARQRLKGLADDFLHHDREIHLRCDDSLAVVQYGGRQVWRRARGFAPQPISLARSLRRCVLGMGADLKNSIALGYESTLVPSPHIGDLDTPEAVDGCLQVVEALPRFLGHVPEVIAVDLHPDMQATRLGFDVARRGNLPVFQVQHHHAHALACLAEHGRSTGLALVFDGTGLGIDGTIWGAELLDISPGSIRRLASFSGVPLPGGDSAVRHPVRQLIARWTAAGITTPHPAWFSHLGVSDEEITWWVSQCRQNVNAPITHAAGRVFDAVSVALSVAPSLTTYEGQSAIRLEAVARPAIKSSVPALEYRSFESDGMLWIDWSGLFTRMAGENPRTIEKNLWAFAFHRAMALAAETMVEFGLDQTPHRTVGLSGGVFMNHILNELLIPRLENRGIEVLIHRHTPPNDGCIAVGQVIAAGR